jgi:hypothetical protein
MGSDAEPVLQKAIYATAMKNAPGTTPSNAFISFPAFLDAHFLEVASDSSLVFNSSFGSLKQVLSLVRAKDIAQALLAEAIVKSSSAQQEEATPGVEVPKAMPIVIVQCASVSEPNQSDSRPLAQWEVCQQNQELKGKKRKAVAQVFGPRLNLRNTPVRQARASSQVNQ